MNHDQANCNKAKRSQLLLLQLQQQEVRETKTLNTFKNTAQLLLVH